MYVAELDRPWLGTPFLLQGFLIEEDREIAQLRQCCREVFVDPLRSLDGVCAEFRSDPHRADPAVDDDFLTIARRLREVHREGMRLGTLPQIDSATRLSQLEAELSYSAPIIDDVHRVLVSIQKAIDAPRIVELHTERVAQEVVVEVADNGPGIGRDQLQSLFEPRQTSKPGGMGVGLGISRAIVDAHGGRLWAEPGPRGCLRFSLPVDGPHVRGGGHAL
jgi:hypothetical protein